MQLLLGYMGFICVALQVRLVNLVKKAVMPYKSHKGKVKSIAVIEPGASRHINLNLSARARYACILGLCGIMSGHV